MAANFGANEDSRRTTGWSFKADGGRQELLSDWEPAQSISSDPRRSRVFGFRSRDPRVSGEGSVKTPQRFGSAFSFSRIKPTKSDPKGKSQGRPFQSSTWQLKQFKQFGGRRVSRRRPEQDSETDGKELARRGYWWRQRRQSKEKIKRLQEAFPVETIPRQKGQSRNRHAEAGPQVLGAREGSAEGLDDNADDEGDRQKEKPFPKQKARELNRQQQQCFGPSVEANQCSQGDRQLRGVQKTHEASTSEVRTEVPEGCRERIRGRRKAIPNLRDWEAHQLWETEDAAACPLHAGRDAGANVGRKMGKGHLADGAESEMRTSNCHRSRRLLGELDVMSTAGCVQQTKIWRRCGGAVPCDSLSQVHDGPREKCRKDPKFDALAPAPECSQRGCRKGEEAKEEGERQGQTARGRKDRSMRAPASARSSTRSSSKFNSPAFELQFSHGAFGRFLRLLHVETNKGLGHRTSQQKGNIDLFPSLLIPPAVDAVKGGSNKRAKRRELAESWEWTTVLWNLFTFFEGGCPTNPRDQLSLAQRAIRAPWTEDHQARADFLQQQVHKFVRLGCNSTLSRGGLKLEEFITKIRPFTHQYSHHANDLEGLTNNAMNVVPSRMSLPEQAGVTDPKDHLKGEPLEAFRSMHQWAPLDERPIAPTRPVFKVLPEDIEEVYDKLLGSKVACLIPVEEALKDSDGRVISGGLFAVPHKAESDRIIFDRRPQNELERRLVLAKLPHGSLLTQIILPKGYSIRGSGDDLANFFYLLKHNEEWLGRNCIGKPVDGKKIQKYGALPNKQYMLAFRVIPMGDCNAVDLAQQTHLEILRDCGTMEESNTISFRKPLPASHTLEGLYIDDHLVMQILPTRKIRDKQETFEDEAICQKSREQYQKLDLPVSLKKQFTKCSKFTAWGTSVDSETGRVGVELEKLKQLCGLIVEVSKLKKVNKKVMQKVVGLVIHPAMHRRNLMAIFQDTYTFISRIPEKGYRKLPPKVREELLWMALCLPVMESNIRWPVSTRVGASDASLSGGGRAACTTTQAVANTLYRYSEHSGEHVRLDWSKGSLESPSPMLSAPLELEAVMNAHCWSTTHACTFSHRQHINILEMKMVKAELKDLTKNVSDPHRAVLLVDSRVVVGAFSKGRSSSRQLNRLLRSMLGWTIAGRVSLHLVWVGTKSNPADHPSRDAAIPAPSPEDPILATALSSLSPEEKDFIQKRKSQKKMFRESKNQRDRFNCVDQHHETDALDAGITTQDHPALTSWTFREVFAGKSCLTKTFRMQRKFSVDKPVELFQKGKPVKEHDILHDPTFEQLCKDARKGKQIWHFGMPCGSFSILQGLNKGTRTKTKPEGNGALRREIIGNEILHRTVYLCKLLKENGSFFTIENPKSSYAWDMAAMRDLLDSDNCSKVDLDQCEYGLYIPDELGELGLAKKSTCFGGNLPGLSHMSRKCQKLHKHVQVIGSVRTAKGWEKRSTLAGAYPVDLCKRYHATCLKLFND